MKIAELLDNIRNHDLVLPEFQREYVWTREQAKQLLVSLIRDYPVGGLLLWKTDNPPKLKNIKSLPQKLGLIQVLLDGQQRLTTLHLLMTADVPKFYAESEIEKDPRDLCINLKTLDFQYYQPSKMKDEPYWCWVTECFDPNASINVFEIAQGKAPEEQMDAMDLAKLLMENLTKLQKIKEIDLPVQVIPSHATLGEAIDIFDRVNSQGTKLTDAELALTHITGKWPIARREMKAKIEECASQDFNFNLTFMVRSLTTVVTHRALFETIHDRPREDLESGWIALTDVLDYLINILPKKAFIHSTDDLNTSNALVPIVHYLSINDGQFPTEKAVKHAINWLYAALIWGRYAGQTDQRLEADVQLVVRESEPWRDLRLNIVDQRGRIDVKPSDFEGRGAQHPLYKALFILAKAHGAVDWFNGLPLGPMYGNAYGIHSHHIFPQSMLYRNGWDSDNQIHRQTVNEIANRVFLTATTNLAISARSPTEYLSEIEEKYPGSLTAQFVPVDSSLWEVKNYRDFLRARRELISTKLNEFMNVLISEPEETYRRPITELIRLGESYSLEFRSSLQWDAMQGKQNKKLRHSSVKTIAAFLNSQGGTLVIGVEDDGTILGLGNDYNLIDGSRDKFEQLLESLVLECLGAAITPYYRIRFEELDEREVCVVDVTPAPEAIFLKTETGETFFVRFGNKTRALDREEAHKYIGKRWN